MRLLFVRGVDATLPSALPTQVKLLLENGADPDKFDDQALMECGTSLPEHREIAAELIDAGAHVDASTLQRDEIANDKELLAMLSAKTGIPI